MQTQFEAAAVNDISVKYLILKTAKCKKMAMEAYYRFYVN